jgi:hypothetical protein
MSMIELEDEDAVILPVALDRPTRARFARFLRAVDREGDAARCAAELLRDLLWDDEFANINALGRCPRLNA